MGKKTFQVWRMSSHPMGRCHVLWFSFFVLTIDHLSSSISSFLKCVPVCRLYLERPSRADGFSSYLAVDHRKWEPCGNEFTFQWVLLVLPFYESTCHFSLWFPIVISSHVSPSSIVRLCVSHRQELRIINHQSSRFVFFISCPHLVYFLPCFFMTFCSDLASFPQSK